MWSPRRVGRRLLLRRTGGRRPCRGRVRRDAVGGGAREQPAADLGDARRGWDHLDNAETGARWRELKAPMLAADLQLGAGPLALALAEQARVIVAGAFGRVGAADGRGRPSVRLEMGPARPAGRRRGSIAGGGLDRLGSVRRRQERRNHVAAESGRRLTRPAKFLWNRLGGRRGSAVCSNGCARPSRWRTPAACRRAGALFDAQVRRGGATDSWRFGAQGAASDDCWELEVLYEAGFAVEAILSSRRLPIAVGGNMWRRSRGLACARSRWRRIADGRRAAGNGGGGWLHLAFQSKSRGECQRFAEQVVKLAAAHRPHVRLSSGRPAVHVHCDRWPVRVPRDAVDIAVETRVAREWV